MERQELMTVLKEIVRKLVAQYLEPLLFPRTEGLYRGKRGGKPPGGNPLRSGEAPRPPGPKRALPASLFAPYT